MNGLELRGDIVIPGEKVGKKSQRGDFTYIEDNDINAAVFGLKNDKGNRVSVIPLAGQYIPKEGDMIVGIVTDVMRTGWLIHVNNAYTAYLNKERRRDDDGTFDLRRLFKEGDLVSVKISKVDEVKSSYVDGPRKLTGGRIVMVSAKKIPRIIGSKKSMLNMLRDKSGCRIVVGQNGIIWMDGDEKAMQLVVEAILKIERESHTKGLTDRISEFMDEGMKTIKSKTDKKDKQKKTINSKKEK
jgi:exosome complex component RRP4